MSRRCQGRRQDQTATTLQILCYYQLINCRTMTMATSTWRREETSVWHAETTSDCDETVPKRPAVLAGLRPTTARGEDGDAEGATERAFAAAAARDDATETPVAPKPNSRVKHGYDWGNELHFLVFLDALPRCHLKEDGRC